MNRASILRTAVQAPRINAITERWIEGCRRELLNRTLVWNQNHLLRVLREYETHHNQHRPHRSLLGAAPLKPLPEPVGLEQYRVRRRTRAGGTISEYRLALNVDEVSARTGHPGPARGLYLWVVEKGPPPGGSPRYPGSHR
jgi:Integrase core domain